MGDKVSFKWDDFQNSLTKSLAILRNEEDFFDVTLVTDDQVQISAHKLVLSSSSSFIKNILKRNTHQHPLLYLSGVNSSELLSVVEYIYNGEVSVQQQHLDNFIRVAEKLKIAGMVKSEAPDKNVEKARATNPPAPNAMDFFQFDPNQFGPSARPAGTPFPMQRPIPPFHLQDNHRVSPPFPSPGQIQSPLFPMKPSISPHQALPSLPATEIRQVNPTMTLIQNRDEATPTKKDKTEDEEVAKNPGIKDERSPAKKDNTKRTIHTVKDLKIVDKKLEEFYERIEKVFTCKLCNKTAPQKTNMVYHIETHMEGLFFQCEMCDKTTKTRQAMRRHYNVHHENAPFLSLFD